MDKKQYRTPPKALIRPVLRSILYSSSIIFISLVIGIVGYHLTADLPWIDSLLNASMILTGMGPIDPMKTDSAKLFASFYALFSGIVFLSSIAVFISPLVHQFMYKLHIDEKTENGLNDK